MEDKIRTPDQNARLHAMLGDISKQVEWHGQKFKVGVWKRLCVASWLRECGEKPLMIPAIDGCGVDIIFEKTSKLSVKKTSELIEWVYAFGAEEGVVWTEKIPEEYLRYVN